ncbi:hypothetical protein XELAEV_18045826mg [Xenopus laevis]|uniref:Uncharacterized protein n=1 Tax=Xenopus laevis TaxID=8355 RepID=A0A974H4P5_XENLA|nr:hypothetical protein XELAEV_18045826mg [Xenopus laevis]
MDYNQLRDDVLDFRLDNCPLGNQGYNQVLLQLFGFTGHGKSALINSLIYVLFKEEYEMHAKSGMNSSGGALTKERRAFELTPTITVVDNRGFGRMNDYEMRMIYAQLGNFMPLNKKVKWRDNYDDFVSQLEDSELDPNYTDFTVPVFVYK